VWVNVHARSYDSLWTTRVSITVGGSGVTLQLREWVNSGLMTFFFFVVGLEARRESDLGELRERRRFALPVGSKSRFVAVGRGRAPVDSRGSRSVIEGEREELLEHEPDYEGEPLG